MKAAAEVIVERPLEAVWLWASDPRNWENWLDGVSDVRLRGRLEQGALTSVIFALGGPLLRRGMNRRIGTQLERLKASIELTGAN